VDYADPYLSQAEGRPPPGLEQFRDEDYRGPLVIRLALDPGIPLPRHVGNVPPLYPRAWGGRAGGALLPFLISGLVLPDGDLLLLTSSGELYRLGSDGDLTLFARLPRGQYNRTNMIAAPDGTVFVSGGFHVGRVFRVSRAGAVAVVAADLADPAGIALDPQGALYIAESSVHRILRVREP
jgi:sugar lactone lactonase YvrE